ncbi:MAG: alpha/beta hydrolase [Cryobacterium sp.]|nr:alpha/beta hydrolase [Cryobacterium sp.]
MAAGYRMHARVSTSVATTPTTSASVPAEANASEAPVAILVHGLAVSHRYFMPTAALLSAHFDVRVVDLPGFGLSDHPTHVLNVQEHAQALAAWMDNNKISAAVLVGNSFGCQVLVDLVARSPYLCSALILSGPTVNSRARTAGKQVAAWLRDTLHEDPLQVPVLLRDFRDAGPRRVWATLRIALSDPIEDKLPKLAVPTLVLRGEREPIVTQWWACEVAKLVPGAEYGVVPASPHNSVYAAADALVGLVLPFLSRVRAGR